MSRFVNVPEFFASVYLVDFSPSLCEVAKKRFARLGWNNVTVVCTDAREFRLADYESGMPDSQLTLRGTARGLSAERTISQEFDGAYWRAVFGIFWLCCLVFVLLR